MNNPFSHPRIIRELILKNALLAFPKKILNGKALACIFLTRFCSTGCPFCFYKSSTAWRKRNIEDQFNDEGIEKFLRFSEQANLGYLLVSGGGEPLNQRRHILALVNQVKADRIVLVTSANWGKNFVAAKSYVDDIYKALSERSNPTTVVLRVSVSEGHVGKIGLMPAINLINIFKKHYQKEKNFFLQIKTFENDKTFDEVLKAFPGYIKDDQAHLVSDNSILIKKIPRRYVVRIDEYEFTVGVSKIFYPSLRANLNHIDALETQINVFKSDIKYSEDHNSTIVFNETAEPGIDWSINYNGDICTWQNQVRDNYMNIYEDDYQTIMHRNLEDPVTYSLIDKGNLYRESVVAEADPLAVIRMNAIGLRDTSGAIIFEEEKTRLYYAIRVLQDYIAEGKITDTILETWPLALKQVVQLSKIQLLDFFNQSTYSIIDQQIERPFDEKEWKDLFQLINLGHYALTAQQIQSGINFYNANAENKISSLATIRFEQGRAIAFKSC